jgi:hypothetical protein
MNVYLMRLLPGPFFAERPHDFMLRLPEVIGGGALHSIGEAYLIFGFFGCAFMGAIFGMLIAISTFSSRYLTFSRSPILWVVFLFPWLLLIRGGWYQFFAILKSIEVLSILVLAWVIVGWVRNRFFEMYAGRRAS